MCLVFVFFVSTEETCTILYIRNEQVPNRYLDKLTMMPLMRKSVIHLMGSKDRELEQ